jgi:hypothetical protein
VQKLHPELTIPASEKRTLSAFVRQKLFTSSRSGVRAVKPARFIAGTALIAGSFLVYLAYPIILFVLPLSSNLKLASTAAVWLLSWGAFSAGIFLAGPEGLERVKRLWPRSTNPAAKSTPLLALLDKRFVVEKSRNSS